MRPSRRQPLGHPHLPSAATGRQFPTENSPCTRSADVSRSEDLGSPQGPPGTCSYIVAVVQFSSPWAGMLHTSSRPGSSSPVLRSSGFDSALRPARMSIWLLSQTLQVTASRPCSASASWARPRVSPPRRGHEAREKIRD